MKKQLIPAVALSFILLGCSSKNTPAETTTSSMATTVETTSTTTSTTTETTVQSTEASSEATSATEATTQAQAANGNADLSLGYDIIVNKKHALPSTYAPGEDPTAGQQVRALIHRMQELGYPISDSYSGYRSYEYQTELYNDYVSREGKAAADTYSARPGYSEHQTGLASISSTLTEIYSMAQSIVTPSTGFIQHAHEYGFIVRFQPGKEAITGYQPEHGTCATSGDKATAIYQSGLSLEEYFGVPGGGYE